MRKILSILMLILVSVLITGCQFVSTEKPKSAYDIACEHGFIGSEEEWLASLKGEKGDLDIKDLYNTALENGYSGTLLEFMKEYLASSTVYGKSAYDLAVDNGYKGTLEQWLASLKGATGEKGESIDLAKTYEALRDMHEIDCSFLEFVQDYLNVDLSTTDSNSIAKNLMSSVIVIASDTSVDLWNESSSGQTGAGIIYKVDKEIGEAYIITNYHVVYGESADKVLDNLYIYFYGKEFSKYLTKTEFIGGSATYDIAVLKVTNSDIIKNEGYLAVNIADSNDVVVGETAIAIGNPESDGFSVTRGIVCVPSENITMTPVSKKYIQASTVSMRVMRIDTPVNSGNSGGGLFNSKGELIGIVNAKIKKTGIENIGYAIPSNIAINVAQNIIDNCDLKENKYVLRCLMGVTIAATDSRVIYDSLTGKTNIIETITVEDVTQGSIADGKLQKGDIIIMFELHGIKYNVARNYIIVDACLSARPGDESITTIIRNGETIEVKLTFKETTIIG